MNENPESRVLRVEPLESRSLLAASLFAGDEIALDLFGEDVDSNDSQNNLDPRQTQEVRTIGNDNGHNVRAPTRPNQANTAPNFGHHRQLHSVSLQFHFALRAVESLTAGQAQPTQQSSVAEAALRPPISVADAALAALTASEATEAVDAAISSTTETQPGLAMKIEQAAESLVGSAVPTGQRQLAPFTFDDSAESQEPADGLIELSPSNLDHPLDDPPTDSRLPWRFDINVLPQIRSVIERAANHQAEIADEAIATWFAGPGGMIAIDQVLLPASRFVAAVDRLDVQLESTVKLHRSLELIASGQEIPLSDVALDAIMASLSEVTESQGQPINTMNRFEVPKIAYPAIAILTAVAIAARRKKKYPDLFAVPFHC